LGAPGNSSLGAIIVRGWAGTMSTFPISAPLTLVRFAPVGRYQGALFMGETVVPRVPATPDLAGIWQGSDVLLQSGAQAWLLNLGAKE
jgi:hypothetical protein